MKTQGYKLLDKTELRSLQLKGCEILLSVISAINKMGLTYYCVGGTALGAIKYNGFIPWDDDIDIAMPREDYMKFIKEGNKFLPNNLFISSCFSEKKYFGSVTKIRDINTAYFDIETARFNICHGVFIDIFPIDGYAPASSLDSFKKKLFKGKITYFEHQGGSFANRTKRIICAILCFWKSLNKCSQSCEKILMKNKINDCSSVFNRIMIFDKDIFGKPSTGTFEGIKVNLPEKVYEYLKICYGDISKDLPKEKQFPHHFALCINTKKSYKEFRYKNGEIIEL